MTTSGVDANELFEPWQETIHGWESFQYEVNRVTSLHPDQRLIWRGQVDASWGLHSSLYRRLADATGALPTEDQLIAAEARLLRLARLEWRLDGVPALQLFAQMQHVGVPTRLLDVTFNPLIAAWFAVAHDDNADRRPGRLLAFTMKEPLQLNSSWNTNTPRWHRLHEDRARREVNWGTGFGRKIWRPPALHGRIPAQNAAFILDGVPIDAIDAGRGSERSMWAATELREFLIGPDATHARGRGSPAPQSAGVHVRDHSRGEGRDPRPTREPLRLSLRDDLRRHRGARRVRGETARGAGRQLISCRSVHPAR
ncbi:hypothetical protein GCM10022240_04130 [Microbacterium kribbense]|uniref:FRG domain-containing protein n=1 Tax=Microbacterium kribbense TaxID=433645 RepID=A0ABP7G270_9MICO